MGSERVSSMFQAAEVGHALSKKEFEKRSPDLRTSMVLAQQRLKNADFPVIVVIAGDDRPGTDDVVNLLNTWFDPRFLETNAFDAPSEEERERPKFWRYWRALPRRGRIGLYSGAWATEIVREQLLGQSSDEDFGRSMEHARRFEEVLTDDGAVVVKFWLHLPKEQLKKRLRAAEKRPDREWRVDASDRLIYENYKHALAAVETFLRGTSRGTAPWSVVESTCDRYRDVTVAQEILGALERGLHAADTRRQRATAHGTPTPASAERTELETGTNSGKSSHVANPHTVLDTIDLTAKLDKDVYEASLGEQQARLRRAALAMRDMERSAVFVFEGWDAGGKGGAIRRVAAAMNAHMYRIVPVGAPTDEEQAHHYLWRFWRHIPRAGRVAIFDRSWYGRVLVERVERLASETAWRRAYAEINDFESQLCEHGIVLEKFWIHISKDEQARRFEDREATPYKRFKITDDDYRNREQWDEYERAAGDMIAQTSTAAAPWQLVAGNDKRWARVEVLKAICDGLERITSLA